MGNCLTILMVGLIMSGQISGFVLFAGVFRKGIREFYLVNGCRKIMRGSWGSPAVFTWLLTQVIR
jgi:hypothetical protein